MGTNENNGIQDEFEGRFDQVPDRFFENNAHVRHCVDVDNENQEPELVASKSVHGLSALEFTDSGQLMLQTMSTLVSDHPRTAR